MFVYGWSWHEICYKYRRGYNNDPDKSSKYEDNRIGWAKLPVRSQDSWMRWIFDDNNPDKLIGMEQLSANVNRTVVIPWEKSLHFVTKPNRGSPEGRSLLRNAYRAWYFKKKIEELEGIGMERNLAGLPVLTTPEGTNVFDTNNPEAVQLLARLEQMISNVRMDKHMGIILPPGYVFDLKSSTSGQKQTDTNASINRWDQRIAITMLADLIFLGADKSGSFALADVKESLLAVALEAQLANIANIINKYAIPRLVRLNSFTGYTDFPKMVPGEIETPDMVQLADAMTRFTCLGMNFFPENKTEKYISSCLGLPELTDDEREKLKNEAEKIKNEKNEKMLDISENMANNTNEQMNNKKPKKEKMTDDKSAYNETYIRGGVKTRTGGGRSKSHTTS